MMNDETNRDDEAGCEVCSAPADGICLACLVDAAKEYGCGAFNGAIEQDGADARAT